MPSKRRPGAHADLEELRPNRFIVHNPAAGPILRGEGERDGDRFLLTTWRRDGLIARLRAKGFLVLTLADQIAALPALPPATPPGPPSVRPLGAGERVSYFAARPLGWQPAPPAPDGSGAVSLREGWVIRRRKGRGPGAYYRLHRETLQPLSQDDALRHGLAQAALDHPAPIALSRVAVGHQSPGPQPGPQPDLLQPDLLQPDLLLPELPLPAEHRALLGRLGDRHPQGTLLTPAALPLVAALLARLGLTLQEA